LRALWVVSAHVPSHSIVELWHPLAHAKAFPEAEQTGIAEEQALEQSPQSVGFEMSVSQPSSGSAEQ
jgi:hypothetical protein